MAKTETLCECGHVEGTHKYGKRCLALKSLRGQSALICPCKKFKSQNPQEHNEIVSSSRRVDTKSQEIIGKKVDNTTAPDTQTLSDKIVDKDGLFERLDVEDVRSAVQKLKEAIMRNGNLKYRIIEKEDGEFEKVRDEVLNNIVLEYIDEIFGRRLTE